MNNKIRILLVEDEFITLMNLRNSLEEIGYAIAGDAMNATEALDILEAGNTDLAILDINLKGEKTGIWLAAQIKQKYKIPFIFLSALSDTKTIQEATATEPYGYLVKPFSAPAIYAAIEIALNNFAREHDTSNLSDSPQPVSQELLINDSIYVKEDLVFRKIPIKQIIYVQAFKNYLELFFAGGSHVIRSTMKDFIAILPADHFVQTHRSFIVNIDRIEKIGDKFARIDAIDIPISNTYREEVLRRLKFFY